MPAEPVAERERGLEVHAVAGTERAQRGDRERFRGNVGGEPFGVTLGGGEADAVHRDAVTRREPGAAERGRAHDEAQVAPHLRVQAVDLADGFDDSGEHPLTPGPATAKPVVR